MTDKTCEVGMSEIKRDYLSLKSLSIENRDFRIRAIISDYIRKTGILEYQIKNVEDGVEFGNEVVGFYYLLHG